MTQTQPSSLAVPSLYLSNWQNMVALWQSHALSQQAPWQAPGIRELHYLARSPAEALINQIVDWTGFFRDETGGYLYTQVSNFLTTAWFESSDQEAGRLTTNYVSFAGADVQPRCAISRSYVAIPNQPLIVVHYLLTNATSTELIFNILDQLHPANRGAGSGQLVRVSYDTDRRLLIADLTASGQPRLALGAFDAMDGYQAGDESQTAGATSGAWASFQQAGTLPGNGTLAATDVDLAFNRRLPVPANGSAETYLYLTIGPDLASIRAQADEARAQTGAYWFQQTAQAHAAWLTGGARTGFADSALNLLFDRSLIMTKHAQNPVLGPFAATTNPVAYEYFSWTRDSSITAIALDASGHHDEASQYWKWMAGVQDADGTWRTRSSVWDGSANTFVTPEYDSVGQFVYGVCRHFDATGDRAFLNEIWPAAKLAADWILDNISQANGLGAADKSIWEEDPAEYNAFTQGWYVAGLYSAQRLAEALGDTGLVDWYAGGPASIISAIQRRSDLQPPGLWNPNGYINRSVTIDNTPRPLADSSSNIIPALGSIDPNSGRAAAHIATMLRLLSRDQYGIARYPHDEYYFDEPYDPAGDEAGGAEPSWPQMSMWVAVCEALTGDLDTATSRLLWFASTAGLGYVPQGEAVNNITRESVLSSMSEPLTAASFVIAALTCQGACDPRVEPPIRQAGCANTISVSAGTTGDATEWDPVPYFSIFGAGRGTGTATSLARVWIANDEAALFIRADNVAGALPDFGVEPKFSIRVYCADFAAGANPAMTTGLDGQPLVRPADYVLERRSDSTTLKRWSATVSGWQDDGAITVDVAPQWAPASGIIEAKIPLAAVSSGPVSAGNAWAYVTIALAYGQTASFVDDGRLTLHYRLTSTGSSPIYGNVPE